MEKKKRLYLRTEFYFEIFLAALLIFVLFVGPFRGYADNGDFNRVLTPAGLGYDESIPSEQRYWNYTHREYPIVDASVFMQPSNYFNTHTVVVLAAKALNVLFYSDTVFHMWFLSAIYSVWFLAAMWRLFCAVKRDNRVLDIILFAAMTLVFADVSHLLYFNSLYAEPVAYLSFLTAMGTVIRILRNGRLQILRDLVPLVISLCLFFGCKPQFTPLLVLFLPVLWFLLKRIGEKRVIAYAASVAVVLGVGLFAQKMSPAYLDHATTYCSVFCGIVSDRASDAEAEQYLRDLGLPQEYIALKGTSYYETEYPFDVYSDEFVEEMFGTVGKGTLVKFYLTHPKLLWYGMEQTAERAYYNRAQQARCEYDGGEPQSGCTIFNLYGMFKEKCFVGNFVAILAFFIAYFIWAVVRVVRDASQARREWFGWLMTLIVFAGIQFVLPWVGNGGLDITKQLYLYNAILDGMLLYLLYLGSSFVYRKIETRRKRV